MQKAVDAGADTYATLYHGCQRHMCGLEADYPVRVEHYLTLVGRALGIEYEDQYKKHTLSGNTRRHPGRDRPLRRSQQHPVGGGEGGHRARVPHAVEPRRRNGIAEPGFV